MKKSFLLAVSILLSAQLLALNTQETFRPVNHFVLGYDIVDGILVIHTTDGDYRRVKPHFYTKSKNRFTPLYTINEEDVSIKEGVLFLQIKEQIKREYHNTSVRFNNDTYTGTYNGVYFKGKEILKEIGYCSNAIRTYNDTTYVCWDGLSIVKGDTLLSHYHGDIIGDFKINDKSLGKLQDIHVHDEYWYLLTTEGCYRFNRSTDELVPLIEKHTPAQKSRFVNPESTKPPNEGYFGEYWFYIDKGLEFHIIDTLESEISHISRSDAIYLTTEKGVVKHSLNTKEVFLPGEYHGVLDLNDTYLMLYSDAGILRYNKVSLRMDTILKEEFNHNSLRTKGDSVFLGSVSGLYSFTQDFITGWVPSQRMDFDIREEKNSQPFFYYIIVSLVFLSFIGFMVLKSKKEVEIQSRALSSSDIEHYIEKNISTTTLRAINSHFNLSQERLYELCKPNTPGQLIKSKRVKLVKAMMEDSKYSVSDISKQSGFSVNYLRKSIIPSIKKNEI